jgi:hypothetical protein
MKRVRYVCETCSSEHYVWVDRGDKVPQEIACIHACDGKMTKRFPRVATHFRPSRGR